MVKINHRPIGLAIAFTVLLCAQWAQAQVGYVDTAYYRNSGFGYNIYATSIPTAVVGSFVQPDSTVIVYGLFSRCNERPVNGIAKLNPDGTNNYSFNPGTGFDGQVNVVLRQSDGKLIVGGQFNHFNGATANYLVRLNTNGSMDTSYHPYTGLFYVYAGAVLPNGQVLIGGSSFTAGPVHIVRLNTNGTIDNTFSSGSTGMTAMNIFSLSVLPDSEIVVAGNYIALLKANGTRDSSFATTSAPSGTAFYATGVQSTGKIITAGNFTSLSSRTEYWMARFNSNGSLDTTFSTGTSGFSSSGRVQAIAIQSNDAIVATGIFSSFNGYSINKIIRLTSNGSRDTTFNPGTGINGGGNMGGLSLDNAGNIYVAGTFTTFNNYNRCSFARLSSNGSVDQTFFNGGLNGSVSATAVQSTGKVILGGTFSYDNNTGVSNIVRLNTDGSLDTSFHAGTGFNNTVYAIKTLGNDKILVGGSFTSFNGTTVYGIVQLNSDRSLDGSFTLTAINGTVRAIQVLSSGKIYVAGLLSYTVSGTSRYTVARLNSNGTLDATFNEKPFPSINDRAFALAVQADNKIIVAPNYGSYYGVVYRLDTLGNVDSSFTNLDADGWVYALTLEPNGKIVIGGSFSTLNGYSVPGIARLKTTGVIDSSFYSNFGFVYTLLPYNNGVIAGGWWYQNTIYQTGITVLDSTGTVNYSSFYVGYGATSIISSQNAGTVNALGFDTVNHRVLAGGIFDVFDGNVVPNFAGLIYKPTNTAIDSIIPPTPLCAGATAKVYYKNEDAFNKANTFTVQLSDTGGSFAHPVNIGTQSNGTNQGWDSISITIPSGTATGIHYKMQITSTNPVFTSAPTGYITIAPNTDTITPSGSLTFCSGQSVTLTSKTESSYTWSTSATTQSITATTSGTYTVTVSSNNCSATASVVVTVHTSPTATASSNSPLCSYGTISLSSTPSSLSYAWSGPNSFSSTSQNPTRTANGNGGTYTVVVTDGNSCTASATASVTVNTAPTATATNTGPYCSYGTIALNGGPNSMSSYSWSGPGSFSSTTQNPTRSASGNGGTYSLTVTDGNGCTSTASTSVTVNTPPSATASSNSPICSYGTINLNSTPSSDTYSWSGPNSFSSSSQNPTLSASGNGGTYSVIVTDRNGCTASGTTSVMVNIPPSVSVSSNSPVCISDTIHFTSTPSGDAYIWSGPNSFSNSSQNPNRVANGNAGQYSVIATDSNGCTAAVSDTITVLDVGIPTTPAPQAVCSDTAFTFIFYDTTGICGNEIEWALNSNFDSSHIISSPGSFSVSVNPGSTDTIWLRSLSSPVGFNSSSMYTLATVYLLPQNITPYVKNDSVCPHLSALIFLPSSQKGIGYYLLSSENAIDSLVGNGDTLYLTSTVIDTTEAFYVKAIDSIGCSIVLNPSLTVLPVPYASIPVFTSGDSVLNADSTTCYQAISLNATQINYFIYSGNVDINTSTGCVSNIKSPFTVMAVAISPNFCNYASDTLHVDVTGLREYGSARDNTTGMWQLLGPISGPDFNITNWGAPGRVYSFAFAQDGIDDGNYDFYLGTPFGGLWVLYYDTRDGYQGNTWMDLSPNVENATHDRAIADVAIDPTYQNYTDNSGTYAPIWIATGSPINHDFSGDGYQTSYSSTGVFVSGDGGQTFSPTGLQLDPDDNVAITKLRVNIYAGFPSTQLFAATTQGIRKSDNNGIGTWPIVDPDGNMISIEPSPSISTTIYASGDVIKVSTDGGNTFQSLPANGIPDLVFPQIANLLGQAPLYLSPGPNYVQINLKVKQTFLNIGGVETAEDELIAYVFYGKPYNWYTAIFDYTTGSGATDWTPITSPYANTYSDCHIAGNESPYRGKLAINPNPLINELYVGNCTSTKVYGSTWQNQIQATDYNGNEHSDIHAIEYIPGTNDVLVGTDGGVFRVYGQGNAIYSDGTVIELNNGLSLHYVWAMGCSATDPHHIVIGQDDNGIDVLTPSGWVPRCSGFDGGHLELWDYANDNDYFAGCRGNPVDVDEINSSTFDPATPSVCTYEGLLKQDPVDSNVFYQYSNTSLSGYTPYSRIAASVFSPPSNSVGSGSWVTGGLWQFAVTSSQSDLFPTGYNFPSNYPQNPFVQNWLGAFALAPIGNGLEYFYAANMAQGAYTPFDDNNPSGTESYLFVNRQFAPASLSSSTLSACGLNEGTASYPTWTKICLPTNDNEINENDCGSNVSIQGLSTSLTYDQATLYSISGIAVSDHDPNTIWLCYNLTQVPSFYVNNSFNIIHIVKGVYDPNATQWTWTLDQDGLPNDIQIETVVYENGSNDGIYLGTAVGVYYKNASLSSWIRFQSGLPYAEVPILDINYCSDSIRAATHKGVYSAQLYADESNSKCRTITSNETWNSNRDIAATITIAPGSTLTINSGAIINLVQGANIIVKPGAKLSVDDATLTNICNLTWDGIIVEGNSNAPQDLSSNDAATAMSTNQGFVYLNNATIENAHEALRVWDYTAGNNTTGNGGIVIAKGSNFNDNRRDAEFMFYQYPINTPANNLSTFSNCNFTTDVNYQVNTGNGIDGFDAFVTMWGTYGISFTDCYFTRSNNGTGPYVVTDADYLGDGIRSIDATYNVVGCTFTGLTDGILVENSDPNALVDIETNVFKDNYMGVNISSGNYSVVACNTFITGHLDNVSPTYTNYGLPNCVVGVAFDNTTQFTIRQNQFDSDDGVDGDLTYWPIIGSGFKNTTVDGLYNNVCYNNNYEFAGSTNALFFGNVANGQNKQYEGLEGLTFVCNDNSNYASSFGYNFYVGEGDLYVQPQYGIGILQFGNNLTDAHNSFSAPESYNNQFVNIESPFYYGYTGSQEPTAYSPTNNIVPVLALGGNSVCHNYICPVGILPPNQTGDEVEAMPNAYNGYISGSVQLASLIDRGNTSQLKSMITNADSLNSDSVISVLDSISPWLSPTVLNKVTQRSNIFNDTAMYWLMYNNPDALIDEQLFSSLQKIWTSPWIDTLTIRRSDTTARTNLQYAINQYAANLDSLGRDVIPSVKLDSNGYSHSGYRAILSTMSDKCADYMRVHDYLSQQAGDSAMALFDSLPAMYAIDTLSDSSYITFKAYLLFKKGLIDDSLNIANLDSGHVLTLNNIAINGYGPSARQAQGILHFFYGYPYRTQLLVQLPDSTGGDRMLWIPSATTSDSSTTFSSQNGFLNVFPNPATNTENFAYQLPCNGDGLLVIADMLGHTMYSNVVNSTSTVTTVDVNTWSNGAYLYRLTCSNKVVGAGKFEVLK